MDIYSLTEEVKVNNFEMNAPSEKKLYCIYCNSSKVIKHGKTSRGATRYRCRTCNKTWVLDKKDTVRPDLADVVEAYLGGRTCRDLVSVYKSSPLRINQKIREFLEGCPNWEDYLDACIDRHEPRLVYLIGRNFSCSCKLNDNNSMFLAMAVDALSNVVLGFEIDVKESYKTWCYLLNRMNCRGFVVPTFMSNGSKAIEDAIQTVFPYSASKIFYLRAYHDKEISCCLSRFPINNKLINDALKAYDSLKNKNLSKYLKNVTDAKLKDILVKSAEMFSKRLRERLDNRNKIRIEGLLNSFQTRFEKFHMVKDDPYPLINGWISRWMLNRLDIGFSRLSVYMQLPVVTSFKYFSCGQLPVLLKLNEDSPLLRTFVIEIAARGLQLPIFFSKCEMKIDKCSLI